MTNIVSISAPFLQYKRSPSTKGTIFLHQDEKFGFCQPYLLHYHRDRLHPPQQGLPHAHHHLHHCMWRWLSPFSESLPILFLRRWNFLEMCFAASRERMLYHPNATAILKVWPLSVQCKLCINDIFPTDVMHKSTRQQYTCVSKNLSL